MKPLFSAMMRLIVWFALFCITTSLHSCAQSKNALIQNSQAFYKTVLPGNIMVGDDGQPVNAKPGLKRFIYIETNGKESPQIESIIYNGVRTSASIFREEKLPVNIGLNTQGKRMIMQPKNGNALWRLEIDPLFANQANSSTIVIKGKYAGKSFTKQLDKETELQADKSY